MNAKVIYLAGVPASGKTTIFKRIRSKYFTNCKDIKYGLVRGIATNDDKYIMLGVFDGTDFEGTDKLSMSVINDAVKFCNQQQKRCVIFIEGDRLFNIRFLQETNATLYIIDASQEVLKARHAKRSDNQNERFLRSRRTKVENFIQKYHVQRYMNNNDADSAFIYKHITNNAEKWLNT
jgi:dephospho-CoA kinase